MVKFSIDRHFRTDRETSDMYDEIAQKLWSDSYQPGEPRVSEGYRIVIRWAHTKMFPELYSKKSKVKIDLSTSPLLS